MKIKKRIGIKIEPNSSSVRKKLRKSGKDKELIYPAQYTITKAMLINSGFCSEIASDRKDDIARNVTNKSLNINVKITG